jgi:hypothetical protein
MDDRERKKGPEKISGPVIQLCAELRLHNAVEQRRAGRSCCLGRCRSGRRPWSSDGRRRLQRAAFSPGDAQLISSLGHGDERSVSAATAR